MQTRPPRSPVKKIFNCRKKYLIYRQKIIYDGVTKRSSTLPGGGRRSDVCNTVIEAATLRHQTPVLANLGIQSSSPQHNHPWGLLFAQNVTIVRFKSDIQTSTISNLLPAAILAANDMNLQHEA